MSTPPASAAPGPADRASAATDDAPMPAGREQSSRDAEPIDSRQLLAGRSEVQIAHRGEIYRLRQTALGKLILTK